MASEWSLLRLGNVCTKIGSGATPRGGSSVYLDRGKIALIRSQNIFNDGFHDDGVVYLTEKHADELSNVEVVEGDVFLNITGDSVARTCQVDPKILPARVNQHVAIIRPDPNRLCPQFLRYYLVSPAMQEQMLSLAGAGATRNALTKGMIESFKVPAPENVGEQRVIAGVLGALDDKIELNRRMNRTLEAMARALFKSWFIDFDPVRAKADGRTPPGMDAATATLFPATFQNSPLGRIPAGWDAVPLTEAVHVNPPRSLKRGELAPYVEMANVPTQGHRPSEWRTREFNSGTKFSNGDTLVARITPCLENGKTAHVDFLENGHTAWGSTEFIVLRSRPPLPEIYTYLLARSPEFRQHAIANMTGSSGRQRVQTSCFENFFVVRPSPPVAKAFSRLVGDFFASIMANDDESRTLSAMRDALLPKLISGEIRVSDAGSIVEEAVL